MKRLSFSPRPQWRERCERDGFLFHTVPDPQRPNGLYWNESAYYELSSLEVDRIESAAEELHQMCLKTVDDILRIGTFDGYHFDERTCDLIRESYARARESFLYGRFDFALGSDGSIKMLEYNTDTPTSLLEASVIQWNWAVETFWERVQQFNSLHEKLIERWKYLAHLQPGMRQFHFAAVPTDEDWGTIAYLAETAQTAGFQTHCFPLSQMAWSGQCFLDDRNMPIDTLFKLYPLEWLTDEPFSVHLPSTIRFLEPFWKLLINNKRILVELWKRYPDHPLLLETIESETIPTSGDWVRKPRMSREGWNIELFHSGQSLIGGPVTREYDRNYLYQRRVHLPQYDGAYPIIGAWMVGHESAGIGIREDSTPITTTACLFVPHIFQ